jgi:hypothetical protein
MSPEYGWWIPAEEGGPEREYLWPYLNRELGVRLFYGGNQVSCQRARIESGKYGLVVIDSSVRKFEYLKQFPPRSIIVFSASDETYSLLQTARVLKEKSVAIVMREYPVRTKVRLEILGQGLKLIPIAKENKLRAKLLFSIVSGMALYIKQLGMYFLAVLFRKRFINCPLGYTGKFATSYDSLSNGDPKKSIIEEAITKGSSKEKKQTLFFAGQRGSPERQLMISQAEESSFGPFDIFDSFGGPTNSNLNYADDSYYVKGMSYSKFSLCPPGNYSAETFRFLESLVLFSYPLRPRTVLSDPSFFNDSKFNWNSFLESSHPELDKLDVKPWIVEELAKVEDSLSSVRSLLSSHRSEL